MLSGTLSYASSYIYISIIALNLSLYTLMRSTKYSHLTAVDSASPILGIDIVPYVLVLIVDYLVSVAPICKRLKR